MIEFDFKLFKIRIRIRENVAAGEKISFVKLVATDAVSFNEYMLKGKQSLELTFIEFFRFRVILNNLCLEFKFRQNVE